MKGRITDILVLILICVACIGIFIVLPYLEVSRGYVESLYELEEDINKL